jgi:hypothetical protein
LIAGEEKEGWNALSFDFFFSRFEKEKKMAPWKTRERSGPPAVCIYICSQLEPTY